MGAWLSDSTIRDYFFALGLGAALAGAELAAGDAAGDGVSVAVGEGCCTGADSLSGAADCSTERWPVIAGNESMSASNINAAAAPMVILLRMLCVPRGPKAVLETLLEKSAPASALPGCSKTVTTKTTQERINSPYKK
ncbi:MAG TPA: hypothetical protein VFV61_02025 [Pyrinomonadaceae bacterium]|nr:hypothetical protein [Pyrinomonadaceae bacterium]